MHTTESARPLTILLVDDSQLIRERLSDMLGRLDRVQIVGAAGNAERGLELLREVEPDVMIIDVRMPGQSGLAMLPIIKSSPSPPTVIVMTGYAEFRKQAIELGADFFLSKATELYQLPKIVEGLRDNRPVT